MQAHGNVYVGNAAVLYTNVKIPKLRTVITE